MVALSDTFELPETRGRFAGFQSGVGRRKHVDRRLKILPIVASFLLNVTFYPAILCSLFELKAGRLKYLIMGVRRQGASGSSRSYIMGTAVQRVYDKLPVSVQEAIDTDMNERLAACRRARVAFEYDTILAELVTDAVELLGRCPAGVDEDQYISTVVLPNILPEKQKINILDVQRQSYDVYRAPKEATI